MQAAEFLELLRPHHWIKNSVIFFGAIICLIYSNEISFSWPIAVASAVGFIAASLLSSGNYILNDLLDYKFDAKHPLKKNRIITKGKVRRSTSIAIMAAMWAAGFMLSLLLLNTIFTAGMLLLFASGLLYNAHPLRLKDVPALDVLMESFNNPLRFFMGWVLVLASMPPLVILLFVFFYSCILMTLKRYAEIKAIGAKTARNYRPVFRFYTENMLYKISMAYAAVTLALFVYMASFVGLLFHTITILLVAQLAWYFYLVRNNPQTLHKEVYVYKFPLFSLYSTFAVIAGIFLLVIL